MTTPKIDVTFEIENNKPRGLSFWEINIGAFYTAHDQNTLYQKLSDTTAKDYGNDSVFNLGSPEKKTRYLVDVNITVTHVHLNKG